MASLQGDGWIDGNPIAPMPGQQTNCPGCGFGVTRPYMKPWEITPMFAANEPAKPPLEENENARQ